MHKVGSLSKQTSSLKTASFKGASHKTLGFSTRSVQQKKNIQLPRSSLQYTSQSCTFQKQSSPKSFSSAVSRPFSSAPTVAMRREARKKEQRTEWLKEASKNLPSFAECLVKAKQFPLKRAVTSTVQINIGLLCNQTCHHCHVESGPTRKKENMDAEKVDRLLYLIDQTPSITTVDITGGAPELNPNFRTLVKGARERGKQVIDRCNLTVFCEPGQEDLSQFLVDHQVNVVASLPCYSPANVDKQRGKGVFDKSIMGLQQLNSLGYGKKEELVLDLVYNPIGPHLPPPQAKLEQDYKRELKEHMGIEFNKLYTITNMPVKRYADFLMQSGEYSKYMELLVNNFNPGTVEGLMCRHLVNVSWDGSLYDCDFNQQLEINLGAAKSNNFKEQAKNGRLTIWDIESFNFENEKIATEPHCFGCTAGAGSSCTGSLE